MFEFLPDIDFFFKLIKFESRNDPLAKNPKSSARGLIQFLDSTARELGFNSSLDLVSQYPTFQSQLSGPVLWYMQKFGKYRDKYDIAMAVFYPKYMGKSPDTLFPKNVRDANPGINTPRDYVSKIEGKKTSQSLFPLSILILGAKLLFK